MYFVKDERHGVPRLIYTWRDPRLDGYRGDVQEVSLEYDLMRVHSWPSGAPAPEVCVGRDPTDPSRHKVFKYCSERAKEGFEAIDGTPIVMQSWAEYHTVPDPNRVDSEFWYGWLDKADESGVQGRENGEPDSPRSTSRDDVAAWVAKQPFLADNRLREVWYLPSGAPDKEIRLLEVNDRLAGREAEVEPIDFGLHVEGAGFRLAVADVTTKQLNDVKENPSRLPPGWSFDGTRVFRRLGA